MKKLLLFAVAMAIAVAGFSQQAYQLKNLKTDKILKTELSGDPVVSLAPKVGSATQASAPIKGTDIVTIVNLGNAANAYSYGYAGGQRCILWANQDLNTIAHVHRQDGVAPNYSGNLELDVSYDGGFTWTLEQQVWTSFRSGGQYNIDAARYPNVGIYNPDGNTDPANAYAFFAGPITSGNNGGTWGAYFSGSANLGDLTDTMNYMIWNDPPLYTEVPDGYSVRTAQGDWFMADGNTDWNSGGTYQENIVMTKGKFLGSDQFFEIDQQTIEAPLIGTGFPSDIKLAFDPSGTYGYMSVLGDNEEIEFSTGSVYPHIWRTDNGGEDWDYIGPIQLGGEDGIAEIVYEFLTDEQLEELFEPPIPDREEILYTTAFDHDLVVDAYGNLHIGVIIGVTGSDPHTIVSAPWFFGAFEIYTPDMGETWYGNSYGKCQNFRGNFGDLSEDNRIQIGITQDGTKSVVTWLDTQLEGVEDNNQPDIFARGFDFLTNKITADEAGEDMPNNVTAFSEAMWQAYMQITSHILLMNGDNVLVPITYEDMDPLDPLAEVQFKYIQDFMYAPSDFSIESNNDPVMWVGVNELAANSIEVSQNAPNPFTTQTQIDVTVHANSNLKLEVFTITGQKVQEQSMGNVAKGTHSFFVSAKDLTQGVYFYTITAGSEVITKKMIVQ